MSLPRRQFMASLSCGLLAGLPGYDARAAASPPSATARNLIFLFLDGAPSHVDTFDVKQGPDTPALLDVQTISPGLKWPVGILPKLAERTDRFSILRSISGVEAVHTRASYHLMTGHRENPALLKEVPHYGSIMSHEFFDQRDQSASLPTLIKFGMDRIRAGFLDPRHLALSLDGFGRVRNLEHPIGNDSYRFDLLRDILDESRGAEDLGRQSHLRLIDQSLVMIEDEFLQNLFGEGDPGNGYANLLSTAEKAVQVLAADRGTRVIQLTHSGWDHHVNIYDENIGLPVMARALDEALAHLLDRLAEEPGVTTPTLLDETLIVAMGEFGRTVGRLNSDGGRDHYPYVIPALFAGGGIIPGQVLGVTTDDGGGIIETGWSHSRLIAVNDVLATLYHALGIDPNQSIPNPNGLRDYALIDNNISGPGLVIDSLFNGGGP